MWLCFLCVLCAHLVWVPTHRYEKLDTDNFQLQDITNLGALHKTQTDTARKPDTCVFFGLQCAPTLFLSSLACVAFGFSVQHPITFEPPGADQPTVTPVYLTKKEQYVFCTRVN